jgi:NADPH2:quinone reductase
MAHRVVITAPGGPEVLRYESYEPGAPAPREVLIRQTAIGLNYIDLHHRTGRYPLARFPSPIGLEAAGVIEAVGSAARDFKPGDRVAYSAPPIGAYADRRCMPIDHLVPLPGAISDEIAAGVMTKGLTAHYLIFTTYPVTKGDVILVHAAAGGVGLILCQWAAHLGATVIGTVSTPEKAALAAAHGCAHPLLYTQQDFVAEVMRLTDGKGVPVVYDSVGRDTIEGSLRCLRPRGTLVTFGTASGPIPPLDLFRLNTLGSLYVTSPAFVTHTSARPELLGRARELFGAIERGVLTVEIARRYPLRDAARAQEDLRARRTSGLSILLP